MPKMRFRSVRALDLCSRFHSFRTLPLVLFHSDRYRLGKLGDCSYGQLTQALRISLMRVLFFPAKKSTKKSSSLKKTFRAVPAQLRISTELDLELNCGRMW